MRTSLRFRTLTVIRLIGARQSNIRERETSAQSAVDSARLYLACVYYKRAIAR